MYWTTISSVVSSYLISMISDIPLSIISLSASSPDVWKISLFSPSMYDKSTLTNKPSLFNLMIFFLPSSTSELLFTLMFGFSGFVLSILIEWSSFVISLIAASVFPLISLIAALCSSLEVFSRSRAALTFELSPYLILSAFPSTNNS